MKEPTPSKSKILETVKNLSPYTFRDSIKSSRKAFRSINSFRS